jgi:hypothetical protein
MIHSVNVVSRHFVSSCPAKTYDDFAGHPRLRSQQDVDGRDKPGHDGEVVM